MLFDHNNDGIKTGTGWIKSDDGLLVRDLNGNDSIDSGAELFGDGTRLQNGQLATTGFAALSDLDTDKNSKIDDADNAFAELKIWRDLNQDGISQASELATLADLGIKAIHLTSNAVNQSQEGNVIATKGTFTRIDGTTGTVADINLASNIVTREFIDQVEIPADIAALPDMTGSGKVRDLQEAATLSPALKNILARFSSSTTYSEQMALIDELLVKWADTSGMAASLEERVGSQYRVEYLQIGNDGRAQHLTNGGEGITTTVTNAENPFLDATYRDLIRQWNGRIHVLEAFNGSYFFAIPGQAQEGGGARSGMRTDYSGTTALSEANRNKPGLVISYSQPQLDQLEFSYQALKQSVYASLVLQTRLISYMDLIEINFDAYFPSPDFIGTPSFDFTGVNFTKVNQAFQEKINTDPVNGLADLIEFNKFAGDILKGGYWDGVAMMEETLRSQPITPQLLQLYQDLQVSINPQYGTANDDIILGNSFANTLSGNDGNDFLLGGTGSEALSGGNGNDTISGGSGNDQLFGQSGDDTYIFRRGYGNDVVRDTQGENIIIFSDLNPEDITVLNSGVNEWDLVFRITDTAETLATQLGWKDSNSSDPQSDAYFYFADGTIWNRAEAMRQSAIKATDGDDVISGSAYDDTLQGFGGDDIISGNGGADIIDGGTGNDILLGRGDFSSTQQKYYGSDLKANGNDTYLFGRGSGHDIIIDGDATANTDRLKFKDDVLPADISLQKAGLDLVLSINDTDDRITLTRYFDEMYQSVENHPYEIEKIEFADGTTWTISQIRSFLPLSGSDTSETIVGYRGDDVMTGQGGDDILEGAYGGAYGVGPR